ncbi:MAG: 4-hydroxythreonine-4-phosphate dehydrogenase PdxA, partial [Balneolaceae bacterium]
FGSGVNFTAGLPVIRTSPDHGTGFDIAGKNRASEESFVSAYECAVNMIKNRRRKNDAT